MGHQCYKRKKNTIMHELGLDSRTQYNYNSTCAHSKKSPCGSLANGCSRRRHVCEQRDTGKNGGAGGCTQVVSYDKR